ncbi:MAG: hypothetical protein QXE69_08260 [Nitrososphaerota archaeon]
MRESRNYYLDTGYLLSYLYRPKEEALRKLNIDKEQMRTTVRVIGAIKPENVKIPVFAMGEAASKLAEKNISIGVVDLISRFEIAWPSREEFNVFCEIIDKLSDEDQRLESMDCLIVALALANPDCRGLLTFDKNLINNKVVLKLSKRVVRKRDFLVTDDPAVR